MKNNNTLINFILSRKVIRKKRSLKFLYLKKKLSIKTRNYVTCSCLRQVNDSDWMHIYKCADESSFVNLTSLTRDSFKKLLVEFAKYYKINTARKGGRPSKLLYHHQALGCILMYYSDTMGYKTLCQIFAIPPPTLSRVLYNGELALARVLKNEYEARIVWPSLEEQRQWALKVEQKNNIVKGRWGFIDGKNLRIESPTNEELQNAYYNGWLHSVFVTGSICFGVDGTITWYRHNCPGSWNDGETSRKFQIKLARDDINLPNHGVLSDSAFPVTGLMFRRIITPLKDNDLERADPAVRGMLLRLSNAIVSLRQSAEWGMGAVEKVYRRLLLKLPYNQKRRALRLSNLFRLYNYRVRTTHISQIRTYFNMTY